MLKGEDVLFSYKIDETKYYLLTGGSGYPLADFNFPYISESSREHFVIPEKRL